MRKIKLYLNSGSSLLYQVILMISGFILPIFIIGSYGSEVNGLTNSIVQYLSIITFLECGVGAVVQYSLYEPLSNKDNKRISEILSSASRFFRFIAICLLGYVILLVFLFPLITVNDYDWIFTACLIVAISISSFAQYYFGIVNQLLLNADQRAYINNFSQSAILIVNLIISIVLIKAGASIQVVKIISSLVFLIRPIILQIYVSKHYDIDIKIKFEGEPIKQKWNGLAQHIAAIVLDSTDILILSAFSSFALVSVYTVYRLVFNGLRMILQTISNGFHSLLGELHAKKEVDNLNNTFGFMEWFVHSLTTIIFGCCFILIIPFIKLYTKNFDDFNYIEPLFASIMTIAFAFNCLSIPYHAMILAAGHYKETQLYFIISAILNLIISISLVFNYGLVGIAIGTLIAMCFQCFWMCIYISQKIIKWSYKKILKQFITDIIIFILSFLICHYFIEYSVLNFFDWFIYAIIVGIIWLFVFLFVNVIFNYSVFKKYLIKIKQSLRKF